MKKTIDRVSIRPGVSLLSVLPHLNYKPWYAIGEFVDNSIQSFLNNRTLLRRLEGKNFVLSIDIDIEADRDTIVVRDNAGGIGADAYSKAFRPAEMPSDATGLSEFGMGMKSAAAWLAPRWTVRTSALGEAVERTVSFDIASIVADTVEELEVKTTRADKDAHFTEIVLIDIRKAPKSRTVAKIREHLASIYRRFIEKGDVQITLNGERLAFEQPEVLVAPKWDDQDGVERNWRTEIKIDLEGGKRVEGWAALRARGSTTKAGFALFRRDRVIEGSADDTYRPREIFGSSNSFVYQRLFGELSLIGFKVSHTKDGIRWDEVEDELVSKLRDLLSHKDMPLLEQAQHWRAGEKVDPGKPGSGRGSEHTPGKARSQFGRIATRIRPVEAGGSECNIDRVTSLELAGETWEVQLALDDNEELADWLTINFIDVNGGAAKSLLATISTRHPFTKNVMKGVHQIEEGLARLVTGLAIAEAIAQSDGVKNSGRIRSSVNELLLLGLADR